MYNLQHNMLYEYGLQMRIQEKTFYRTIYHEVIL
jgi:hypothetical protein